MDVLPTPHSTPYFARDPGRSCGYASRAHLRVGWGFGIYRAGGMSEERLALELSVQNRQIVHGDHVGGILGFSVKCSLPFNHLFHRCK